MTAKIKADIETLMLLKAISIFIIIIPLLLAACADENSQNNSNIIQDNHTKYDFVYNEPVVIYSITGNYDIGDTKKDRITDDITVSFNNVRNEEVYRLIPESDKNKDNGIIFELKNPQIKCNPLAECSITFSMLIIEQSPLNDNFTVNLPVTLLNKSEMDTFIGMNAEEKYKPFAMKYLNNRIYIKYKITGNITKNKYIFPFAKK